MSITRRPEIQGDAFDPYIRSLWNRKWLIVGLSILSGIITYAALLVVPEKFRVSSEIFVNQFSSTDEETPNPETVSSLLKSQGVLEKVRNDYAREFNISPPPKIENFVKQFTVESLILQDTTVRKQFSPVLNLEVESKGSSETRYIMERWLYNFIDEFGNYTTQEAVIKRDAFIEEKKRIEDQVKELENLRAENDSQLPYLKRMLAEKLELLTPSRLTLQEQDENAMKVDIQLKSPRLRPGLLEQYSDLELKIDMGQAPTTAPAALAEIGNAIHDAQTSISQAQQLLASARFKELQTNRLLSQLTETQNAVNAAITKFTVAAAVYKKSFEGGIPKGGDIRALSIPISPENRIWPKRTLTSAIVMVLVGILTACWVVGNDFSRRFFRNDN